MHIKRDMETIAPTPVVSPPTPPHVSSSPIIESAPVSKPSAPPKSSMEKISPFANVSEKKSAKLAALEASGTSGYVLLLSKTVSFFGAFVTSICTNQFLMYPIYFFPRLAHSEEAEQ